MSTNVLEGREARAAEALAVLEKVRMHVATYHCFYGALQARLKLKADWRHKTMYTDAVVIGFNPEFVLKRPWDELVYIKCHEVTHCACKHPFRRGKRDPRLWNQACDHVVNLTLNNDPDLKAKCPKDALRDERFAPNGVVMAAEEVYAILEREQQARESQKPKQKQEPQKGGDGQGDSESLSGASDDPDSFGDVCDVGASGEPMPNSDPDDEDEDEAADEDKADKADKARGGKAKHKDESDDDGKDADGGGSSSTDEAGADDDADADDESDDAANDDDAEGEENEGGGDNEPKPSHSGADDSEVEKLSREWDEAVMTAQLASGGDVDIAMQRVLGKAQERNKSFAEYIDEFVSRCTPTESSWSRPARRFETYMPSVCIPTVKSLVLGIDTSCSVDNNQLALMEVTAQRIMDEYELRACVVIYCDTQIRGVERFEKGEPISLANARGGGCTSFHPVFRRALEMEQDGEEVAGVIYLSDLEGRVSDVEDFMHIPTLWVKTNPFGTREPPNGLGVVCCLYD